MFQDWDENCAEKLVKQVEKYTYGPSASSHVRQRRYARDDCQTLEYNISYGLMFFGILSGSVLGFLGHYFGYVMLKLWHRLSTILLFLLRHKAHSTDV